MRGCSVDRRAGSEQKLFVELLAGTQARVGDLDIAIRIGRVFDLKAAETDHQSRQFVDLDGIAHLKSEDVAAFRHGASLDDQFGHLRNGHEMTDDLGMRDGDRAAGSIWRRKRPTTEPELSSTLPNLTIANVVTGSFAARA